MISGVAAAAHAPFVAAVSPKLFNFDRFTELSNPRDLAKIFDRSSTPRGSRSANRRIRATSP